ncbi:MAG: hypothetical protein LBR56_00500, partial [Sporomusaceae bacterium]|nr:hypothetical protein [Sporomusaceae bacterium]
MFSVRHGQISIAIVCMVLGIMLAVQYRTAQEVRASSVSMQRVEDLSQKLLQAEKEKEVLTKQVEELMTSSNGNLQADSLQSIKM